MIHVDARDPLHTRPLDAVVAMNRLSVMRALAYAMNHSLNFWTV